jgi:hypothetical protein
MGQNQTDYKQLNRFEGKPLLKAIKYLQKSAGVAFSYSSGSMDGLVAPSVPDTLASINGYLTIALENTPLDFVRIATTYVIFPKSTEPNQSKPTRSNFALSGVVKDFKTGEALPFATIGIVGMPGATTTNTDGKFTLMMVPSDTVTITVRYLGYRPYTKSLSPGTAIGLLTLELERQERMLPSVEVAVRREQMLELSNKAGQLAFNPSEIGRLPNLGEPDLFATLRLLPGVGGSVEASSGLRIRGSASDENLVLFDGMVLYHIDHFFGFLTAVNSNVVKNVQVSKGGFGAKYGSRASGMINITGIDGNKKDAAITVEASALSASVLLELPVVEDKASFVFAYRRAFTDVLRSPTYQRMFNNLFNGSIPNIEPTDIDVFDSDGIPDFTFYDLNAKFHFQPSSKDAIAVSFYQGRDDLNISFGARADGVTRISEDASNWGNRGLSVKWSRKWNDRFFSYANYGVSLYSSNLDAQVSFFFDEQELLSRRFFEQRVNLQDNTLRVDHTYELGPNGRLQFGHWNTDYRILMQSQDQDFIFSDSLQQASLNAVYLDYEQVLGRLTATSGLRVSLYDATGTAYFEPRVNMLYELTENIGIKAAAGRYYQMIRRLNERSLYFSIPETWALAGQADVPVLRSDQIILGALLKHKGWELDVEAYHKAEDGIIEFLSPEFGIASGSLDQFAVGGERRVIGLDLLLKRTFGKHNVMVSYTYLDARSRYAEINDGQSFPSLGLTRHEAAAVYNVQLKRWDFSGSIVVSQGLPYTPVLGTFIVTLENGEQQQFVSLGSINSERSTWNHRMDVAASYTLPLSKGALKFGLSIFNLYNSMNVRFIDYFEIPNEENAFYTLGRREVLGLGITPSVFMRLRL